MKASRMPAFARYLLTYKRGDCYRCAAGFAYIARALGYDTAVRHGSVLSVRGYMVPHAWTEVKVGSKWYICDINMQIHHPNKSTYLKTKKTYPYRHAAGKRYTMSTSKGAVKWK